MSTTTDYEQQAQAFLDRFGIKFRVTLSDTFKDWCSEFGGSEDSIKALQTYRRCKAFAVRLNQFFTPEEITALREIV